MGVKDITLINIEGTGMLGVQGIAGQVFTTTRDAGVNVIMISQASSEHSICIAVKTPQANQCVNALSSAFEQFIASGAIEAISTVPECATMAMVGKRMDHTLGVSAALFTALTEADVNVVAIAQGCSEHNLTIVIKETDCDVAVKAAHDMFFSRGSARFNLKTRLSAKFGGSSGPGKNGNMSPRAVSTVGTGAAQTSQDTSRSPVFLGICGCGVVGSALLNQLANQVPKLRSQGLDLRVAAIASSGKTLSASNAKGDILSASSSAPDTNAIKQALSSKGQGGEFEGMALREWGDGDETACAITGQLQDTCANQQGSGIMVDCTSSAVISDSYLGWLEKGISVVIANKKAGSESIDYYNKLQTENLKGTMAGDSASGRWKYEATVGAGLPILDTLSGFIQTGDQVITVEGIMSGTLSCIFSTYDGTKPFSEIVQGAKDSGFTEPDPRDDLSGMDVARKVVILARECGLNLTLDDVPVESLVPAHLSDTNKVSIDDFLSGLKDADEDMKKRCNAALGKNEVLRFVGKIDVKAGTGAVSLQSYSRSHPFGGMEGSDNMIVFETQRYSAAGGSTPMVIRGPGAGPDVTAAGMFHDIVRIATSL